MSKIAPKFRANVIRGQYNDLIFKEEDIFSRYLGTLPDEVEVVVRPYHIVKSRSIQQNKFLWGVAYFLIAESTGYTSEEVHELMKYMFLCEYKKIGKQTVKATKSTTSLSTIDFEKYLEDMRRFASIELGISIPLPNEVSY